MSSKTDTKKSTKKSGEGLTDEEKAAMKETLKERKAEARAGNDRAEGEKAILAAIGAMKEPDRSMAKRLHEIVTASAPALMPKTWYGMPAYANAGGKVICFFQAAGKFNVRPQPRLTSERWPCAATAPNVLICNVGAMKC